MPKEEIERFARKRKKRIIFNPLLRRRIPISEVEEKRRKQLEKKEVLPKEMLKWVKKQPPGAIMRPETFREIVREAKGARSPVAVAGASYWKTVKAKYKKRRRA